MPLFPILTYIAVSQAVPMARVTVDPGSDSGALRKFSIAVPKQWLKNGKWPMVSSEDPLTHACGGSDTFTISLSSVPGETAGNVLSSLAMPKKHHPNLYWDIRKGSLVGGLVLIPIKRGKSKGKLAKDLLTGRLYAGNHEELYFEYRLFSHEADAADRQLVTTIVTSIQTGKVKTY